MTGPGPNEAPVIVCENVSVAYGREEVVRDVSLEVRPGQFMPFVGPNGAGKTTLLRAIVGLLEPRRGRILTPFRRAPPGYVPQQKALDPLFPVSVRQIVVMGLYPKLGPWRRLSREQHGEVDRALEMFDLAGHHRKTYAELSGGMRQKTLLARAFVSGAEVFVMDEPTSELDEDSETEVLDHLGRLSRDQGKTVLLAHHGLDEVARLAPVVCLLEHGRAQMVETATLTAGPGPASAPPDKAPPGYATGNPGGRQ